MSNEMMSQFKVLQAMKEVKNESKDETKDETKLSKEKEQVTKDQLASRIGYALMFSM